jgi:hypothetical protein
VGCVPGLVGLACLPYYVGSWSSYACGPSLSAREPVKGVVWYDSSGWTISRCCKLSQCDLYHKPLCDGPSQCVGQCDGV